MLTLDGDEHERCPATYPGRASIRAARVARPGPDSSGSVAGRPAIAINSLTRALDHGALAGGPGQIGRREAEPAQASGGADGRGPGREPQRRQHPLGGDLAEDAQCAADVLVVDESIGERDPAAEKGGQSGRVQVMPRPGEQVLRAVVSVGGLWGARSRS